MWQRAGLATSTQGSLSILWQTRQEADFLEKVLRVPAGASIVDLARDGGALLPRAVRPWLPADRRGHFAQVRGRVPPAQPQGT